MKTRDKLRKQTIAENANLPVSSEIFREIFTLNGFLQLRAEAERQAQRLMSPSYIAEYLGMSVGEVKKHLGEIQRKFNEAQRQANEAKQTTDNAAPSDTDAGHDNNTAEVRLPEDPGASLVPDNPA